MKRWTSLFVVSAVLWGVTAAASAQEADDEAPAEEVAEPSGSSESRDEEARALFSAASTAFEDARYEDALGYFQRAYELSGRSVLLYNVGVAADRLRRDQVALDAFERFLAEVPEHPRRRDVEVRVEVLRAAVASSTPAAAPDAPEDTGQSNATPAPTGPAASSGPDVLTIVGPIVLGAVGLAGVLAAIVGIAGNGDCIAMDAGECIEVRRIGWAGVGVFGGLGIAAIAGAVIWLIVGLSGDEPSEDSPVALTPNGVAFHWSL